MKMKRLGCLGKIAVAIVVIVMLVLLRAAMGQVRGMFVRSACIENMRKIGTALQMYAADLGGCAPPYTTSRIAKFDSVDFRRFAKSPYLKKCLAPYGAEHVWHCPLDPTGGIWGTQTFPLIDHAMTSYYVDARVAILQPVNIANPPVIPASEWEAKDSHSMMPARWANTDDISRGGPYYMECCTPTHGVGVGRNVLKFDGSVVHPEGLGRGL